MSATRAMAIIAAGLLGASTPTNATSIAPVTLANLFSKSSAVAIVHVVSGDEEHYQYSESDGQSWPVCKVKVLEAYKGTPAGETIDLAPCEGMQIGNDYALFMEDAHVPTLRPDVKGLGFADIKHPKRAADAGYGEMLIEYICVFDDRGPDHSCDYGVRLNPSQVTLPKSLKSFPRTPATSETNYRRWVRRSEFAAAMHSIAQP